MEKDNVCIDCENMLDKVASLLNLNETEIDILTKPRRTFTFSFPVIMRNAKILISSKSTSG